MNPHVPTTESRAQVRALSQFLNQADIAAFIGISEKTLRKHYAAEIRDGSVRTNVTVATNLLSYAAGRRGTEKAQVTAAIFWMKTRGGWKEKVDVNVRTEFVEGARSRLAAKLGGDPSAVPTESETSFPDPVGRA